MNRHPAYQVALTYRLTDADVDPMIEVHRWGADGVVVTYYGEGAPRRDLLSVSDALHVAHGILQVLGLIETERADLPPPVGERFELLEIGEANDT